MNFDFQYKTQRSFLLKPNSVTELLLRLSLSIIICAGLLAHKLDLAKVCLGPKSLLQLDPDHGSGMKLVFNKYLQSG